MHEWGGYTGTLYTFHLIFLETKNCSKNGLLILRNDQEFSDLWNNIEWCTICIVEGSRKSGEEKILGEIMPETSSKFEENYQHPGLRCLTNTKRDHHKENHSEPYCNYIVENQR